jgi:uncharacterized protein (TIGR02145 family)
MKKISRILSAVLIISIFMTSCGGGSYNEVIIGKQVWMTNNLDLDKFRNGDSILEAKAGWEWEQAGKNKQPAWCYNNNDATVGKKYGKLYNWYAVNDPRGLAPDGWHVPSDSEWTTLTTFLGGEKVAGTKMKSTSGWFDNLNGTNISGFSGLPGGQRRYNGSFLEYGGGGTWWSSTVENLYSAWAFFLFYGDGESKTLDSSMSIGYSVRCIKDSESNNLTDKNIIENPTIGKSMKIGNLEIAQNDFPNKMNWLDAKSACEKLENGWRLPSREELNLLYKKRATIGNLVADGIYWSSTEVSSDNVWEVDFGVGGFGDYYVNDKLNNWNVRAVRIINTH